MKIAYLIAHPGFAGSEKYSFYLAGEAQKNGHQVSFIVGERGPLTKELEKTHLPYQVVPMESSFNLLKVWRSALSLKKVLKDLGAEIVHVNMLREHSITILAKLLGLRISVVRTFHRLDNFNWKMKPLLPIYNYFTAAYIAVSEYMGEKMIAKGIKEEKITTIHNGNPDYGVAKHQQKIGFLGRVSGEKGIFELAKLIQGPLIIGGAGPDLEKIRALGKESITLLGEVRDLHHFFESISLLVLPTKAESTIPLAVTEAFSAGIPVVMFDIPALGNKEYPGLIKIKSGDFEEMSLVAAELLANSKKLEAAGAEARATYEQHFRLSRMWKETNCLYKSL